VRVRGRWSGTRTWYPRTRDKDEESVFKDEDKDEEWESVDEDKDAGLLSKDEEKVEK